MNGSLLASVVAAELSNECRYVNSTFNLTDVDQVKTCFESYQIDQDVIDAMLRNLDITKKLYAHHK